MTFLRWLIRSPSLSPLCSLSSVPVFPSWPCRVVAKPARDGPQVALRLAPATRRFAGVDVGDAVGALASSMVVVSASVDAQGATTQFSGSDARKTLMLLPLTSALSG
jgi:hypothetical protein